MRYIGNVIRPPSEADSLILQITLGCSHNKCTFCGVYRDQKFRVKKEEEIFADVDSIANMGSVRRIFLADGDALILPAEKLIKINKYLIKTFPDLQRIGIYASAKNILNKKKEELEALAKNKLSIIYIGLESGSDRILKYVNKNNTASEFIEACLKTQDAGIKISLIVLLGLGGRQFWQEHAVESAKVINAINPRFISALTLMLLPNTEIYKDYVDGKFELPGPIDTLKELRLFVENLDVDKSIFRANHASNYFAIGGTLAKDKAKLLKELDYAIENELIKPEVFRGL